MIELTSDPRNISRIDGLVQRIVQDFRISPNRYGDILVSLTEAVNNAIIHGNRRDTSKKVKIDYRRVQQNRLAILVSDQGTGFDPGKVSDPTCPDNINRCGGRGVFLMRELCDTVKYHNNGSTIEMQFNIR